MKIPSFKIIGNNSFYFLIFYNRIMLFYNKSLNNKDFQSLKYLERTNVKFCYGKHFGNLSNVIEGEGLLRNIWAQVC